MVTAVISRLAEETPPEPPIVAGAAAGAGADRKGVSFAEDVEEPEPTTPAFVRVVWHVARGTWRVARCVRESVSTASP
jgi:hypothetical protein